MGEVDQCVSKMLSLKNYNLEEIEDFIDIVIVKFATNKRKEKNFMWNQSLDEDGKVPFLKNEMAILVKLLQEDPWWESVDVLQRIEIS